MGKKGKQGRINRVSYLIWSFPFRLCKILLTVTLQQSKGFDLFHLSDESSLQNLAYLQGYISRVSQYGS